MNSMMQSISGLISGAAQSSSAAAGVKAPSEIQQPEDAVPVRSRKPVTDEYVPEEKQEPSGLYWLGRDEDGQPKIYYDGPKQAADESKKPDEPSDASGREKKAAGGNAERCTCSTDQVDREIENLKRKREKLEQQISAQTDGAKIRELKQNLAQVENELSQKDNDAYRRRHAVFS